MRGEDNRPYVGIMAQESEGKAGSPPFGENEFYARLCRLGRTLGLNVYVFSPLWVDPAARTVRGYTCGPGAQGWIEKPFPLPDLIYDRGFFVRAKDYVEYRAAVSRLQQLKPIPYLGRGLKSKWEVLVYLRRDPRLRPYLPKTSKLAHPDMAAEWLDSEHRVFLKPLSGSQGRGTAMVERLESDRFRVRARDGRNCPLEYVFTGAGELSAWLCGFTGDRSYLIQQYLQLETEDGHTWDIRSLVQKNGSGVWELTGMAVRRGHEGSITSNLHGGGDVLEVLPFLEEHFGRERAPVLEKELRWLSERIPPALEASNGRMAELGLDLGIDRTGRIWIIEANTKPGRSVFRLLRQEQASLRAARNPMAYAKHLLRGPAPVRGTARLEKTPSERSYISGS